MAASELASAQSFVIDLRALLGVDKLHPTPEQNYMFERPVTFTHGDGSSSAGRIDCYRHGHFVLEAKKLKAAPASSPMTAGSIAACDTLADQTVRCGRVLGPGDANAAVGAMAGFAIANVFFKPQVRRYEVEQWFW